LKLLGLQIPHPDEEGTAMTVSATAAVPKDLHWNAKDDGKNRTARETESSLISKNPCDPKSDMEALPLLQGKNGMEIEKYTETHSPMPMYQHSDITDGELEDTENKIELSIIDEAKTSSVQIVNGP